MKNSQKILVFVLLLALLCVSMFSCNKKTAETYTLVHSSSEGYPPIVFTFKGGKLEIAADTSGLNSNAIDNLSVLMVSLGVAEGNYKYSEKDGVITTQESLSPLSNKATEFRSYFNGKYMLASTFNSYAISTNDTEGTSEFTIEGKGFLGATTIFEFHSDGSFNVKNSEKSGTYTFKDGLIEMTYGEEVAYRYLAIGDGTCYTEYLIKK